MMKKTISMKAAIKLKETFSENYGGNNVSMTLSNVKDTKNIEDFLVENITEIHYESEDENCVIGFNFWRKVIMIIDFD